MGLLTKLLRLLPVSTVNPALTRYYLAPHVKLHRINHTDAKHHTHPWHGLSIIFGSYIEELSDGSMYVRRGWNFVHAYKPHRVHVDKPVWTLFINGPRINEHWSYGSQVKPWEGSDAERRKDGRTHYD